MEQVSSARCWSMDRKCVARKDLTVEESGVEDGECEGVMAVVAAIEALLVG